jgi:hypothetical protein
VTTGYRHSAFRAVASVPSCGWNPSHPPPPPPRTLSALPIPPPPLVVDSPAVVPRPTYLIYYTVQAAIYVPSTQTPSRSPFLFACCTRFHACAVLPVEFGRGRRTQLPPSRAPLSHRSDAVVYVCGRRMTAHLVTPPSFRDNQVLCTTHTHKPTPTTPPTFLFATHFMVALCCVTTSMGEYNSLRAPLAPPRRVPPTLPPPPSFPHSFFFGAKSVS